MCILDVLNLVLEVHKPMYWSSFINLDLPYIRTWNSWQDHGRGFNARPSESFKL